MSKTVGKRLIASHKINAAALTALSVAGCFYTWDAPPIELGEGDVTGVLVGLPPGESGKNHALTGGKVKLLSSPIVRSSRDDGRFVLRNLPKGDYRLRLEYWMTKQSIPDLVKHMDVPIRIPPTRSRRPSVDLGNVVLVPPGSIHGTVKDVQGTLVGLVDTVLVLKDSDLRTKPDPVTGEFLFEGVGEGDWEVAAARPGGDGASTVVHVSSGDRAEVELRLHPRTERGSVQGSVVFPDGPVSQETSALHLPLEAEVLVSLFPLEGAGSPVPPTRRPASFFIGDVDPGVYVVVVEGVDGEFVPVRIPNVVVDAALSTDLGNLLAISLPSAGCVDLDGDGVCALGEEANTCLDSCRSAEVRLSEPCRDQNGTTWDCDDDNDRQSDAEERLGGRDGGFGPCRCGASGNEDGGPTCENDPLRTDRDHDGVCDIFDVYPDCAANDDTCRTVVTPDGGSQGLTWPATSRVFPGGEEPALTTTAAGDVMLVFSVDGGMQSVMNPAQGHPPLGLMPTSPDQTPAVILAAEPQGHRVWMLSDTGLVATLRTGRLDGTPTPLTSDRMGSYLQAVGLSWSGGRPVGAVVTGVNGTMDYYAFDIGTDVMGTCQEGAACANGACECGGAGQPPCCGLPGKPCCSGTSCAEGGCCVSGLCIPEGDPCGNGLTCQWTECRSGPCGTLGQSCCPGHPPCTQQDTRCNLDGVCDACGTAGTPCCEGGVCNQDGCCTESGCVDALSLCQSGGTCTHGSCGGCGGQGEPCCGGTLCSQSGVTCGMGTCVPCGGVGEPCCADELCNTGCCSETPQGSRCVAQGQYCASYLLCGGANLCSVCGFPGLACAQPVPLESLGTPLVDGKLASRPPTMWYYGMSPSILGLPGGRALLFFNHVDADHNAQWVLLQRAPISAGHGPAWFFTESSGTVPLSTGAKGWVQVHPLGGQRLAITWVEDPLGNGVFDIHMALVDVGSDGTPSRTTNPPVNVSATGTPADQSDFPVVRAAGDGRIWVAWREWVNGPRVAILDGDLGGRQTVASTTPQTNSMESSIAGTVDPNGAFHVAATVLVNGVPELRYWVFRRP